MLTRDDEPADEIAGPLTTDTPDPGEGGQQLPGAVVDRDPAVALDPAGPYADGDTVEVSTPEGYSTDALAVSLCAVVADAPGGPVESCDPTFTADARSGGTSASVTIRRTTFTTTGWRDCEEPAVTCRLIALGEPSRSGASTPLRFTGDPIAPDVNLAIDRSGEPGTFELTPSGLTPHPTFDASSAGDVQALDVDVCGFTDGTSPFDGPFGGDIWSSTERGAHLAVDEPRPLTASCDAFASSEQRATIDPGEPDATVTLRPRLRLYGFGGWVDCRSTPCAAIIRRTVRWGEGSYHEEPVAAALLPTADDDPVPARPRIRIETPGPHLAGQTVQVALTGLPDGFETHFGVCHVSAPWSCGYPDDGFGIDADGTYSITLPADVDDCRPDDCYVELGSSQVGLPPPATAPLDTSA